MKHQLEPIHTIMTLVVYDISLLDHYYNNNDNNDDDHDDDDDDNNKLYYSVNNL